MTTPLRIFISSPGDVAAERRRAALVIEKIGKDYVRFFEIKPYLWETEPMLASGHFQDAILSPGDTDILILILWARLGTPLPAAKYRGSDGRTPVTGTEWEFESALEAHRAQGTPDLIAYKKKASPKAEYTSGADLDELRRQLQQLDVFWSRHFVDQGEFRAAFGEFETIDDFDAKLERDLRRLIERRVAALSEGPDKAMTATWLTGSPFRGLETFRFEHAPIFFGRSEVTKTAVEHLVENADAGRPFLLVLGASGSGKSSVAQAGIVPALGVRGVVPGVGELRRAVIRPGGHQAGPFAALALGLGADDALPELLAGHDIEGLARHLQAAAADPGFPLVSALATRDHVARQRGDFLSFEETRIILVVDQLEELFTLGEITPGQRETFVRCLKGLMDSGRIFIVATMRSDYWHRAAEIPMLVALADGHGRLDLLPPTQAEVTEMIRRPAEVAGLSFEVDMRTEIRLDAALAEEAAREPGALPLLSFLLDALFETDVQAGKGSTLRYASMRALGGLNGAIATRAEETFSALPDEAQRALPNVLRALVTVSRAGAEPTARAVPLIRFAEGSPERGVVQAFLDPRVRLLIADGDGNGARIRLAHEALITHWDRAQRQIAQDRDDLRTRAAVEEALTEWRAADARHKHGQLLRDPYLANAVDLAKRWSEEFDQDALNFIQASRQRARLLQQVAVAAAVVLALTTVAASIFGVLAYRAQLTASSERARAETQRNLAEAERNKAEAERNKALVTQSRFLADLAGQQRTKGDAVTAVLLAIEALPDPASSASRPSVPEAEFQLDESSRALLERFVLVGHTSSVARASFSPDGKRIVTASFDQTARLWDAETGRPDGVLSGHADKVNSAAFSPDGKRIVTASWDNSARLWDAETGKPLAALRGHKSIVSSAVFSSDGRLVVTASWDKTAQVWNAETGEPLIALSGHGDAVSSAAFSPDGKRILTASWDKTARLWDTATGAAIVTFTGHGEKVASAAFSPDGTRIVTASWDKTARLWEAETGKLIGTLTGHGDIVQSAMFSFDGKRILTASSDGVAAVWDAQTGKILGAMAGVSSLTSAVFSPDGKHAVTTLLFDQTARLWELSPRKPGRVLIGHDRDVESAAFSFDGKWIVTASLDGTAATWDPETRIPVAVFEGHEGGASSASFSPDGKRILTTALYNGAIWDAATSRVISVLSGHTDSLAGAAFSADGKRVVTASSDKTARVWDAETGKQIMIITGHQNFVSSAAFSPDGKFIITASWDNTARVWDAETGDPVRTLSGHAGWVSAAAFSSDGKRILTASADGTARIWDAGDGKLLHMLRGHAGWVHSAAFSLDGKLVVTGSLDKTARLWNAETGELVRVLVGHTGEVNTAVFSPDGKRIVTASKDKTARLWDVSTNSRAILSKALTLVPRCLTREQRLAAFLEPEPPAWCIEREKWPYQTQNWKTWLTGKHANVDPPFPDTPDWTRWVSDHNSVGRKP